MKATLTALSDAPITEKGMFSVLSDLMKARLTTLVLVTHNLALAEQAEQIVHIANGAIVA